MFCPFTLARFSYRQAHTQSVQLSDRATRFHKDAGTILYSTNSPWTDWANAVSPTMANLHGVAYSDLPDTTTIDWYSSAVGGSVLSNGSATSCYVPLDELPDSFLGSSNFTYHAQARDLRTGFVNTNRVAATLTLVSQPALLSIHLADTNVIVEWFGAWALQSTTALEPPIIWTHLTNGVDCASNQWTRPTASPQTHTFCSLSSNAP